jgi:uncharacterized membrane protein YfcA
MVTLILPFTSFAIAGSLLGAALVPHVPQATLKRGFAIFLLGLGVLVAAKNLSH